jgi:hypothetical protein
MEVRLGVEPSSPGLQSGALSEELTHREDGSSGRIRTCTITVNSRADCQLSDAGTKGEEVILCPKCGSTSGNDWSQCKGSCPMPGSPDYDPHRPDALTKDELHEMLVNDGLEDLKPLLPQR